MIISEHRRGQQFVGSCMLTGINIRVQRVITCGPQNAGLAVCLCQAHHRHELASIYRVIL